MKLGRRYKDPQDSSLFTFDWRPRLGAATIASYELNADSGIEILEDNLVTGDQQVSLLVGGGTDGVNYDVTCTIETSDGQTLERTGVIAVRQR